MARAMSLPPQVPSRERYPSDLNDAQWQLVEPFVRGNSVGPQPVVHPRREVLNAILYVSRTGVQWRYLPHDFPDWQSVYAYFRQWKKDGTLKLVHDVLRGKVRQKAGRSPQPTAGILDSQSVKSDVQALTRGYDANKKVKGRKRHLLVDTLGLLLVAWISTADVQDRDATGAVLPLAAEQFPTLQKVWADSAYEGPRVERIAQQAGVQVEIVKRTDPNPGFVVQAKRWIVERTLGWLSRERRLARDYERTEESAEAFVYTGMIRLMLRRLA
ncbi:putative transposase [Stigmatella erecta]|uniref:Putative transposase n=2 Tax=Stigmatella erecta TaxID=83460 RepID=A0A1I0LGY1_9BACT|nr:putative transposase [Stigmatella erecta]